MPHRNRSWISGTSRHAWLASVLLLIACTQDPKQYTLVAQAGPVHSGTPRVVKLRKIAIAGYLDRSQIVRSSQGVQFVVVEDGTWGEPFDTMLARVLVQALSVRLPDSTVFVENTAISNTPTSSVGINVLRFDADHDGTVVLLAQIAITGRSAKIRNVRLTAPSASSKTPDLVYAMSVVTSQLAENVGEMLEIPASVAKTEQTTNQKLKKRLAQSQMERAALQRALNTLSEMLAAQRTDDRPSDRDQR
jgi:uncharacterized lipoprotein YmbA